jgi:hypothetical protein
MSIPAERTANMTSEGTHLFKITKAEEKASPNDGSALLVIEMTCQDSNPEDQGVRFTEFFAVDPNAKARWKFNNFLDALQAPKKGSLEVGWFMGKLIRITIVHDEYQGTPKMQSQQYLHHTSTANPEVKHKSATGPKNALSEFGSSGKKSDAPF